MGIYIYFHFLIISFFFCLLIQSVQYIYLGQMDDQLETDIRCNFKKGMTLFQYMNQMKPNDNLVTQDEIPQSMDDLYESCLKKCQKNPSTKLIPFNIPQMDEDNYQSSVDYTPETPIYHVNYEEVIPINEQEKLKEKSIRKNDIQITTMYNPKKPQKSQSINQKTYSKQYRIKHQSNSPFKRQYQFTPTKGNFSKTLYGNTFLSNNLSNMSTASSTLYQNKLGRIQQKTISNDGNMFLKGTIHSRESKNQKYFQQKNKRQMDNLIQYENNIRMKLNSKINVLDIRVDGFKDKICQRKNRILH